MSIFRILACSFILSAAVAGSALAADPLGVWTTEDGEGRVRVSQCGANLCGNLVWLKEPNDATGAPKKDFRNEDAAKRSRPMLGVPVLLAMAPSGSEWKGSIYNAGDGKTYSASFKLMGDSQAQVQGCVAAVFCKSQVWTRQ